MSSVAKAKGNEQLKAGDLHGALASYAEALALESADAERAAIFANRALVHLKLQQHDECIADCSSALQLQPRYVKALYRRALAREAKKLLPDAFRDVREALRIDSTNREAQTLAARLQRELERQAASSDLSTPSLAVEALTSSTGEAERIQAAGKLSKIAEDKTRALELLHAKAVPALKRILPADVKTAAELRMPLEALAVEALERLSGCEKVEVLHAIAADEAADVGGSSASGATVNSLFAIATAAADARSSLKSDGDGSIEHPQLKNTIATAQRCLTLLANLAGSRGAVGSQDAQGAIVRRLLPFTRHTEEAVQRAALDALVRVAHSDIDSCRSVLPEILRTLMWLVGDEDSPPYRVSLSILSKLFAKASDDKQEEEENIKALCGVCEKVLSPILRNAEAEWEEHAAAIHGVTAVLAVNKAVGAWLLRQESIFWSLAEVLEIDDEDLQKSLAEVYAHAAGDVQHFRDQAGDEPIKHLKQMLKSSRPKVRARACVALAKVALLHQSHRVSINPTGKLLTATLGLLEAKVAPSVHRWAVEALMFLSVMPDMKEHLAQQEVHFGSLVALADSVGKDSSFHFSLVSAFRRLCVEREKPDDQKKLEQEMEPEQIEQMRHLAAGGAGAAPSERPDDPEVLHKLAARLVEDDAVLVVSELVTHMPEDSVSMRRSAAQVLLSMSQTTSCRGKIVQQGGFKALCSLAVSNDTATQMAASWAFAKVGISINPNMYPRRLGSGPESMVKPLLKLIDTAENELQQFEASMTLCNLATVEDLNERIVAAGGWRTLQMALACENELVQRAALEAMSNLVTNEKVVPRFMSEDSTDVKIFVGFCGADDEKTRIAASGAVATLAGIPEIGAVLIKAKAVENLVEIALLSETPELLHRAAVCLDRFFRLNTDLLVGAKGEELPDNALPALGALTVLAKCSLEPAKKAALTALVHLQKQRPDLKLPHPDAVAQVVANLKEENERRRAEAEAELEAEEAAKTAAGGAATELSTGTPTIVEEDEEAAGTVV